MTAPKQTVLAVARGTGRFVLLVAFLGVLVGLTWWWIELVERDPVRTIAATILAAIALRVLAALIGWELDEVERRTRRPRPRPCSNDRR